MITINQADICMWFIFSFWPLNKYQCETIAHYGNWLSAKTERNFFSLLLFYLVSFVYYRLIDYYYQRKVEMVMGWILVTVSGLILSAWLAKYKSTSIFLPRNLPILGSSRSNPSLIQTYSDKLHTKIPKYVG